MTYLCPRTPFLSLSQETPYYNNIMTVRLPKYSNEYSLLVLLLCLCKSFKERYPNALILIFEAKADAKVMLS